MTLLEFCLKFVRSDWGDFAGILFSIVRSDGGDLAGISSFFEIVRSDRGDLA